MLSHMISLYKLETLHSFNNVVCPTVNQKKSIMLPSKHHILIQLQSHVGASKQLETFLPAKMEKGRHRKQKEE